MKSSVALHQFTDYRTFLVAHGQEMKRSRQRWSYGAWAKALGLKTTSSITKIIQGIRNPGDKVTERLIHYFEFNATEAEYFRDLIRLHKVRDDARLSVLLMEKMGKEHPNGAIRILDDRTFSVISNWYYLPVREMVRMPGFVEDAEWISKKLKYKVTPREISQALKAMESLDLLKRDVNGKVRITEGRINTASDIASEAVKRYHEQMLDHARTSIRTVDVNDRELNAASLVMKSENLPRAKEMIREFRMKFARMFEEDGGDAVFQVQVQLFPLTKKEEIK